MTEQEKRSECLRICGPDVTPDTHRLAPEMCPILDQYWKNPTTHPDYDPETRRQRVVKVV